MSYEDYSLDELYEHEGIDINTMSTDKAMNNIGAAIAVGFAMMEQDDE